ncbi:MAG: hypothetical protein K5686_07095 [Lachnospiraceae bacterium]|nr:hypothetical protein [Lachnospiraceae bacterium]
MNNSTRCGISIAILTLLQFAFSYGTELLSMMAGRSVGRTIGAFVLGGILVIMVNIVFFLLNRNNRWLSTKECALCIFSGVNIYLILMILLYPKIEVPYSLIPSAEMGFAFLQFLNQLFCCGGALICWIAGLILLIIHRKDDQGSI